MVRGLPIPCIVLAWALLTPCAAFARSAVPCVQPARTKLLEARPGDSLDSWTDTEHFRIHYATSGDARLPEWPDSSGVDSLGLYLEESWRVYHRIMQLSVPPTDGARGGDGRIDCYLMQLPAGSGRATPEAAGGAGDCAGGSTGYFEISLQSTKGDDGRDLAAHEYFHIVQFGLGCEDTWFDESTAAWVEITVWPSQRGMLDDAACLLQTPYLELWNVSTCRQYGSMLFWIFCTRRYGDDFVPAVMRRLCGNDSRSALREELSARGSSLAEALTGFALWNETTGPRDDGLHYPAGSTLPEITFQAEHAGLPVQPASLSPVTLARAAGTDYIRFEGTGARDTLWILFDGDSSLAGERSVSLAVRRRSPLGSDAAIERSDTTLVPGASGDCLLSVPRWPDCLDAVLIVTNFDTAAGTLAFSYSAWETGPEAVDGIASVFPNPSRGRATIRFRLARSGPAALDVFDAGGRRVRRLLAGALLLGENEREWDGEDDQGRAAGSGVYWVRLSGASRVSNAKLVILR